MKKNWFFILMLAIASLALAGTAAYFSVFGLSKLFYSAGLGITILAASLEFAKLVTVSYVYRFWKDIKKGLRGFYVFAVVFIMLLTSIGIYGFLTGAYQQSANTLEMRDSQIQIAENKKALFVGQLERTNTSINSSNERIQTLTELRSQQEARMDTLYARNYITVSRRVEQQIENSDNQITQLNNDITQKMKDVVSINDSIAYYDQQIIDLKMSDVSNEIGPYKFVSNLTGIPMDKVVNLVALLIVVVFDPLAITLLIGVNQLTMGEGILPETRKKILKNLKKKKSEELDDEDDVEIEEEIEVESIVVENITSTTTSTLIPITTTTTSTLEPTTTTTTTVAPITTTTLTTLILVTEEKVDDNGDIKKIASIRGVDNSPKFVYRGHIQDTK